MRTRSSWEICSGNTTWWTFSLLSVTNCLTTSPHYRSARLGPPETHRLLQMFGVLVLLNLLSFSFTASHHYPGCAAVLGRNFVCHNELALSQSVRVLEHSINQAIFWNLLSHGPCFHAVGLSSNINMFTFSWLVSFAVLQTPEEAESHRCRINRWEEALLRGRSHQLLTSGCGFYHPLMYSTTCLFTAARLFFLKWSVLYHPGNQGLMDILDMPNTNKYSFEGWDNSFIVPPNITLCCYSTSIVFSKISPLCFFSSFALLVLKIVLKDKLFFNFKN